MSKEKQIKRILTKHMKAEEERIADMAREAGKEKAASLSERGPDFLPRRGSQVMSSFSRPTLKKPCDCRSFMTSMNWLYFTSG